MTRCPRPRSTLRFTRVLVTLIAATLASAPLHASASPAEIVTLARDEPRSSARALTERGQASFDVGDYQDAATAWRMILDILPENQLNREERENALLISLEASKHAFRRDEFSHDLLRQALTLCDAYTDELARIHGPNSVSPAVVESRVELETMLAQSGPRPEAAPRISFTPEPKLRLERDTMLRGPSGTGLIVGGSALIVAGLAMMPLVIIGARDDNTAMLASGSVLMGALTIGGATMLGIGIRRRVRYTAFAPALSPSYVGISLQRRF